MKTVILEAPGSLVVCDRPQPVPGRGDVVVEVRAALTCGTDVKAYRRGHPKFPCPTPFGHEASGVIVAKGDDVTRFAIGDALMTANSGPCGNCYWCRMDEENLCDTLADELMFGAYAEYLLVPARILRRNAYVKPEHLPFEHAALLEPLSSVCFGLTKIPSRKVRGGATVLILGSGPIAMLWMRCLQAHGAERVIVAARRAAPLEVAGLMGACATVLLDDSAAHDPSHESASAWPNLDAVVAQWTDGRGCDAVIECTGQPAVWEAAPRYARRGGSVVLFGGCAGGSSVRFDTSMLHYDGVEISSPFHFRPRDVAEAHRLLGRVDIDWSPLIGGRALLDDVPSLFEKLARGGGMKTLILSDLSMPESSTLPQAAQPESTAR